MWGGVRERAEKNWGWGGVGAKKRISVCVCAYVCLNVSLGMCVALVSFCEA